MKEFITAVEAETAEELGHDNSLEFKVGYTDSEGIAQAERIVHAYRPKEGMVTMTMALMGRHAKATDKIAGIVDLFFACFKEGDKQYFVDRLYDNDDPFGADEITPMMTWMLEEWSGRPIK